MVSDEGTLRALEALLVNDWRALSDMMKVVYGVKKEMERRDWRKSLNLYARRGTRRGHVTFEVRHGTGKTRSR